MAQWIEDPDVRRQITSSVIEHVRQQKEKRKVPPKNPDYWLSRTIRTAFRKELDNHAIAPPNTFTEEVHSKIKQLVRGRVPGRVPQYLEDAVVRNVYERFRNEVEPIQNLEHWANSVISDACTDAIREETGVRRKPQGGLTKHGVDEEVHSKIKQLVRGRVPQYLEDAVVRKVYERFRDEVEPIQNLEQWANSVISDASTDTIREETGVRRKSHWPVDVAEAEEMVSLDKGTGIEDHCREWLDLIVRGLLNDGRQTLPDIHLRAVAEHCFECKRCACFLWLVSRHLAAERGGKKSFSISEELVERKWPLLFFFMEIENDQKVDPTLWSPEPRLIHFLRLEGAQRLRVRFEAAGLPWRAGYSVS